MGNLSDDFSNIDIRIKPNFYIHTALLMIQRTLAFSVIKNASDGLIAYSVLVEQIESLCRAAKHISDDYDEDVKKFTEEQEKQKDVRQDVKMARLANKKLELLMKNVFATSPSQAPLGDKDKKIKL